MSEFGRNLWKQYGPTPLLKPDHLELVSQDHVWMAFEYLQEGRLLGQPVPVLHHSHSEKLFPHIQRKSPVFVFAHCLWSCQWATPNRTWFHFLLLHPFMHLYTLIKFPSEPFILRLNSPSYLSLSSFQLIQSLGYPCAALLESLQNVHVSVILRSPELDTAPQVWPHQCWGAGKDHFPQPDGNTTFIAA